ncbi:MAG: META domain-containing protein [Pseudorhodobacter sp.]
MKPGLLYLVLSSAALPFAAGGVSTASATPALFIPHQIQGKAVAIPAFGRFRQAEPQEVPMTNISGSKLEGPAWTIMTALDTAMLPDHPARLVFTEGRLRFEAPCNIYTTQLTEQDGQLVVMPFENMPKVCDPEVMEVEEALLRALTRVTEYEIDGTGELTLKSVDGSEMLRAKRQKPF